MIKTIEKDNDVIYLSSHKTFEIDPPPYSSHKTFEIDPPPYSKCESPSYLCHHTVDNYLEEIAKLKDGWYDVANSGGVFMFNVKNGEIIHSYKFAACSGDLYEEFHKEGEVKDWESVADLHNTSKVFVYD